MHVIRQQLMLARRLSSRESKALRRTTARDAQPAGLFLHVLITGVGELVRRAAAKVHVVVILIPHLVVAEIDDSGRRAHGLSGFSRILRERNRDGSANDETGNEVGKGKVRATTCPSSSGRRVVYV